MLKTVGSPTDDDGQPLLSFEPPFVRLPDRPNNWQSGDISLRLKKAEAKFLRERLAQLRGNGGRELSLLARLVRTEAAAPAEMWADETYAIAGADQPPLVRARQAASLAASAAPSYDALLERIVEIDDKRQISARHREHLGLSSRNRVRSQPGSI